MRIRKTKQELEIERIYNKINSVFTADDLYNKIKHEKIGIATIYRFLKDKSKNHELHTYLCNRKTLYSKEQINHCHFTCENCHKTIHFQIKDITQIQKSISNPICHIQIDAYGLCEKCKKLSN
ncbi:transcriptional repressor [Candidatus Pacearchaeota archaeon]|nr:transcriptional repressor [Candidatus Pacearchaeota archaeon]